MEALAGCLSRRATAAHSLVVCAALLPCNKQPSTHSLRLASLWTRAGESDLSEHSVWYGISSMGESNAVRRARCCSAMFRAEECGGSC